MKKKTTIAILLATTMMLALMGCGAASTDTDSSSDAAYVAEVDTDSESNTTDDTTKETDADTSSDSASADSSNSSGTATASTDDSFTYKNETLSILDDLQTTLDKINAVGTPCPSSPIEEADGSHLYLYDSDANDSNFLMETFISNGTETVGHIGLIGPDAKTAKGIGIGSTVEDLTSAYGEPTRKSLKSNTYNYEFDKLTIAFMIKDGKITNVDYLNSDFLNSRK